MTERWNIQISIQRVNSVDLGKGNARGIAQQVSGKDREITKVLDLAITADSEQDAYSKAQKMLSASEPEPKFTTALPEEETHLHRASCDDSIGNQVCGYPPGPSIASVPVRRRGMTP